MCFIYPGHGSPLNVKPCVRPPPTPQLQGKTDQRFVEAAFRLARDHLGVKTALTPAHFFAQVGAQGFKDEPRSGGAVDLPAC